MEKITMDEDIFDFDSFIDEQSRYDYDDDDGYPDDDYDRQDDRYDE